MTTSASVRQGGWKNWHAEDLPLRLGVSSCLLGENVRYDSGHARDRFVVDVLGRWFEFVPRCPEVEIGMGTPRPTVRLVDEDGAVRMVAPSTEEDFTERMTTWSRAEVERLRALDLDGYVLKKNSPTCGLERIKLYKKGMPSNRNQRGLFAAELTESWAGLPIEEEGRLNDPLLRENFIERVFARNRWRRLVAQGLSRSALIEFHTAHKLLLRAHDEVAYQRLGKLVGSAGSVPDEDLFRDYEREFQDALRTKATVKANVNVLQHALGHLKDHLGPREKRQILSAFEDYAAGLLPLIVPLTLLRYEIRRYDIEYLAGQLYFDPHPKELMLRNHA